MTLEDFKKPIKVGQHGHVRLVDTMGDDSAIVQAARVSYGAGTKTVNEDRGLIRYLMRHKHTTPMEMCVIKLHLKMPMHVARQWIRHRTASVNEVSTRYSVVTDDVELIRADEIRLQSSSNKQGSEGLLWQEDKSQAMILSDSANTAMGSAYATYESMIAAGVAREQARNLLPLATYTEFYWRMDLHNLLHFLRLRLHPHAQQEIREFAEAIAAIVREWCPLAWEAFYDYGLNGTTLSRQETEIVKFLVEQTNLFDMSTEERVAFLEGFGLDNKRERIEFFKKVK